ncbi:hydroxylysine kinase /5-phosphonooxy-L-lysine phospho-lyase apoenzyme [Tangfeifania diversioriginum]|uniref:Hydroxylysine kinase /5-phosphonooxy-L-lysine phospho-lyase apoenzyme n=1 Tax=Tangfeifania diversioriginum TaxID=1168035 RepID=A0A1M6FSC3_9BACT|nr:aminotransferase class III-fold pyridoxal phosphate-dependent enzyme [Tangfeifania diversioriginum]SHJ00567.1 hydroxylysine kinase /5-phosphonooxy-L-lysine phospho-lyase apoenzyme [Tangfeifania diversioriginum]
MEQFLTKNWNLKAPKIKQIEGYSNSNFKIEDSEKKYILKMYPNEKHLANWAEAENRLLLWLNKKAEDTFPFPVLTKGAQTFSYDAKKRNIFRLLTWLDGDFWFEVKHTSKLVESFGKFLAKLNLHLRNYQDYVIEARHSEWDLQHFLEVVQQKRHFILIPENRKLVDYFLLQYRENVLHELHNMRKSVIHGDANDRNVLVQNEAVSGIIDFGDMCYSQLINELAIGITYAVMGKENPVEWALSIITGYHEIFPLQEREVDLLYWLIAARLCMSVCHSAFEKIRQPENKYIAISEKPAWDLLHKWVKINPVHARNEFRKAARFSIPAEKSENEVKSERLKSVSSIFSVSYKKPVYMERAAFQYMFDKYGNSYLDAYNNIPHVGHSHPLVVEAGQKQMARLNTNTRYLYDNLNEYTANLLSCFPKPLNKVFLVNSGSAATDLALRMARHFTGRKKVAVVEHGYHGNTQAGIEISHYKFSGKGGQGASENVICLPIPDVYRGEFRFENAGVFFAKQAIQHIQNEKEKPAAFIAEPIVGCGGQVPLAKGYLKEIYTEIRTLGGICISDEVQTGFGRLGNYFWGFEMHGVVPDMVILGKPMGNGHPMAAMICTDEIAEAFNNGMEFFSSFGGNPVSCSIGQAVLDVLAEEHLQQNAKKVGDYYLQKLTELQQKNERIGDVRGSGLFIGFEFVKDRITLEPDTELAQKVKNELREKFVLVSTDGPFDNVIKSKPPLCFSKENVDEVILAVERILKEK